MATKEFLVDGKDGYDCIREGLVEVVIDDTSAQPIQEYCKLAD